MANNKICILITLLLQLCTMMQGSPCSKYYSYTIKPQTSEIVGQIKISSPPINTQYRLKVGFNTNPSIHKIEPVARLELIQFSLDDEIEILFLQESKPFIFHVHFPMGQAIPKLTKIWFIDREICNNEEAENIITTREVEYVSSVDSSTNNPSHQDLTHSTHLSERNDDNISSGTQTLISAQHNNYSECGISSYTDRTNPLINNGEETLPGQWPWLAALFAIKKDHEFKCAGSLLTNKHVITAAHCLKLGFSKNDTLPSSILIVALGRFSLRNWRERGSVNREVSSYVIHPDYTNTYTGDSDLAILILRRPVEFTPFIRPLCLWPGSTSVADVVNRIGWVVGWGEDELGLPYTDDPRMARVPIVSQEVCLRSHQTFVLLTSNRTFCAGLRDHSGPCNGDSGSGLVLYDDTTDRYQLRGIVSRSLGGRTPSCDLLNYVVYVDVAKYISWIEEQIFTYPVRNNSSNRHRNH